MAVLEAYGIHSPRSVRCDAPEDAAKEAAGFGPRVVLKILGPLHKTEVGAVRVGVDPAEVAGVAAQMAEHVTAVGEKVEGFLVQELVPLGVEMLVGVAHDPTFGPVVACGIGGTAAELMKDVSVRLPPFTDADVAEMLRSLRGFPLLEGYRGSPAMDIGALEELVLRVGVLVQRHPAIAEMDCNPVTVTPAGATVLDVRIRVEPAAAARPIGSPS
jgi:acyl-CoA synthetase (NDP forming)